MAHVKQDATLKRCFGRAEKICDCDWEDLKQLRSLKPPHEPIARLSNLLHYLASPETDQVWVMLDIKVSSITTATESA